MSKKGFEFISCLLFASIHAFFVVVVLCSCFVSALIANMVLKSESAKKKIHHSATTE